MGDPDVEERRRRLKREVTAELEARSDVTGFEFQPTEDPGVHVEVEEDAGLRLYHVTLESLPDDDVEANWSYLGPMDGD